MFFVFFVDNNVSSNFFTASQTSEVFKTSKVFHKDKLSVFGFIIEHIPPFSHHLHETECDTYKDWNGSAPPKPII